MWDPALAPGDVEAERTVILDEILMHADEPADLVAEHWTGSLFPGHPLGRDPLGTAESVRATSATDVREFFEEHYRPQNMVVSVAGDFEHEQVAESLQARFTGAPGGQAPAREAPVDPPQPLHVVHKTTEQAHLAFGARSVSRFDESRFALAVLNHVLGGGLSSRLFQKVREQRGLAYSIFSDRSAYQDAGSLCVLAGTAPDYVDEVLKICAGELEVLATTGITDRELAVAKGNLRAETLLACEDSGARMSRIGAALLLHGEVHTVDEVLARVALVEREDVQRAAEALVAAPRSLSVVGPFEADALRRCRPRARSHARLRETAGGRAWQARQRPSRNWPPPAAAGGPAWAGWAGRTAGRSSCWSSCRCSCSWGRPSSAGRPSAVTTRSRTSRLRVFSGELLAQGHLPLWNPYIWSGSPLLGGLNAGSLYPFTLLLHGAPGHGGLGAQPARGLLGRRPRPLRPPAPVPPGAAGRPAGGGHLRLRRGHGRPDGPPPDRRGHGVDTAHGAGPGPPGLGRPADRADRRGRPGVGPRRRVALAVGGAVGRHHRGHPLDRRAAVHGRGGAGGDPDGPLAGLPAPPGRHDRARTARQLSRLQPRRGRLGGRHRRGPARAGVGVHHELAALHRDVRLLDRRVTAPESGARCSSSPTSSGATGSATSRPSSTPTTCPR